MQEQQSMFNEVTINEAEQEERSYYSRKNLFDRTTNLVNEINLLKEDLKQLKKDFTKSDDNPRGLEKEEVTEVVKFATKAANKKVYSTIDEGKHFEELTHEFGAE